MTAAEVTEGAGHGVEPPAESMARGLLRAVASRPAAVLAVAWIAVVAVAGVGAPAIAPHDPLAQDLDHTLAGPTAGHLLGTDELGRDLLSRLLYGSGHALAGAAEAVVVAIALGVPAGLIAGYVGGWFDAVASRAADALFAVPAIVVLLAVAAAFGNHVSIAMGVLGVIVSASFMRLVRASTRTVRHELYVDAARVAGLGRARIVARHVLPNVISPIVMQSALTFGLALLVGASLGFIGLGPPPPAPDWGTMIATASQFLDSQPWLMVPPGLVLLLTVLAANFLADAVHASGARSDRRSNLPPASRRSRPAPPRPTPADTGDGAVMMLRDLTISFPTGVVIDDVSFELRQGETLGLVGESGSGKTLTALAALGLVPSPGRVSGEIWFEGQNVAALDERALAAVRGRGIGLVMQEPMSNLDPSFTIGSQLREPLRHHAGLDRRAARAEALELLRRVGIGRPDAVYASYPHQVSGGMAQRVAIAIALTGRPRVLIADEPTSALDVTLQDEILALLRRVREELGTALLLVTHDLGVVADSCQRAIVMYAGQIVEQGDVAEMFARPAHPYTRALLASVPPLHDGGSGPVGIPGTVPPPAERAVGCRFRPRCPLALDACGRGPIALSHARGGGVSRCLRSEELIEG